MSDFNSSSNLSQISSIRESLRFTPVKSSRLMNDDYYFHHNSSNKEDVNHNMRSIDLLNDFINLEKSNLSSMNLSLRQKQNQIGEQIIQVQNKRNSSQKELRDSNHHKFLSKTHSAVDMLSSSKLINQHEYAYIKESLEDIKVKLIKLTKEKEQNAEKLNSLTEDLKKIKDKKREIEEQLENKLSQRESFEEIYRYNISKYSKSKGNSGHYKPLSSVLSPCYSDNIIISKDEVVSLSNTQYKEVIITILNDLFDSKTELIYHNLIEAVITKAYSSINSFSGPNKSEIFFLKLSKAIGDIYPIINNDALMILSKYSVKLRYIDNIIERDMHFVSKEYKTKKKEYKAMIKEIKDNIPKCELQISETLAKEKEFLRKLELIQEAKPSHFGCIKDCERNKNQFEYDYEDQTIDEDHSFGVNHLSNINNKDTSNNFLMNLVSEKQKEKEIEESLLLSNHKCNKYNDKIEEIKDSNNTIILQLNNNNTNNETKSTFHRSASNTGSAFMKNESSLSWLLDEKINQSQLSKSPPKIGRNPQSYNNSNHFNCSIRKQYADNNINNNVKTRPSDRRIQLSNEKTRVMNNNKVNKRDLAKQDNSNTITNNNNNNNNDNNNNNNNNRNGNNSKQLIRSASSISIKPKGYLQSSFCPLLNNTYCYYKHLSKFETKFNPLFPQSFHPEKLGYEKGFISFNSIQSILTLSPSATNTNHSQAQLINLSDIKNTIVLNLIKDISFLHRSYQRMLQNSHDTTPMNINHFIQREEFKHISLSDNDKIKSALCSFYSFSLLLKDNGIIELVFVSYLEFKSWLNGLGNILNKK